jgi:hypothetical protein
MHRSGTSAVANAMVELGVGLPVDTEIIANDIYNERGYWESRDLVRFDEALLRQLGGTWSAPPLPVPGWEHSDHPEMRALRAQAVQLAARCFGRPPMVLKDPRLCITLPMWRTVFTAAPCVVLILRDPMDVARSLKTRNDFPLTLGLAIWERYVRQSVASVAGLAVYAVEYGDILADPRRRMGELVAFLRSQGVGVPADGIEQAVGVFEVGLRHHHRDDGPGALVAPCDPGVLDALRPSYGAHEHWLPPALPDEPAWVHDIISLTAAGQAVTASMQLAQQELKWIKRSRLFRTTRMMWRVTGTGPVLSRVPDEDDSSSNANGSSPAVDSTSPGRPR